MSVNYEQLALDGLLQLGAATAPAQLDWRSRSVWPVRSAASGCSS